jgi:hypothetical protein
MSRANRRRSEEVRSRLQPLTLFLDGSYVLRGRMVEVVERQTDVVIGELASSFSNQDACTESPFELVTVNFVSRRALGPTYPGVLWQNLDDDDGSF